MKLRIAALVLLVGLCGCISSTGDGGGGNVIVPVNLHQTSSAEGSGMIGSVFIGAFPWTYPIQWVGSGDITLQYPMKPYIILEGTFVWEPIYPNQLSAIQQAVCNGQIAVRSKSKSPIAISAPGTIR